MAQKIFLALIFAVTSSAGCYAQNTIPDAPANQPAIGTAGLRTDSSSAAPNLSIRAPLWFSEKTEATLLSYSSVSHPRTPLKTGSQQLTWLNPDSGVALNSPFLTEDDIRRTLQIINSEANNSLNQGYWINPLQYKNSKIHHSGNKKIRSGTSALSYMLRKSLRRWWKDRDNFSVSNTNNNSTGLLANANNFSRNKSNSWDYGLRMSGSKVKLTLKREL